MSDKEHVQFKIGLSRSGAFKKPAFCISLSGEEKIRSSIEADPEVTEYFEFAAELDAGNYTLEIDFLNKLPADTKVDNQGRIVDDLLLNIESIEIDEISIGQLIWTNSVYNPIYPDVYTNEDQKKILEVKNCVNLGWNGTWKLPFTSPVYIWLLENF